MTKKQLKEKFLKETTVRIAHLLANKKATENQHQSNMASIDAELEELKVREQAYKTIK